jgi:hypothetical protein
MADYPDPLVVDPANGVVRGDNKAMPNRGTGSGSVGMGAPYGASIDMGATNSMGSIHGACGSDAMDACYPQGDGRFTSAGHSTTDPGSGMGGAAKSDAVDEVFPEDQRQ